MKDGSKYFQIDSYARTQGKGSEKPSQVIQFDKAFAEKIVSILMKEFELTIKE